MNADLESAMQAVIEAQRRIWLCWQKTPNEGCCGRLGEQRRLFRKPFSRNAKSLRHPARAGGYQPMSTDRDPIVDLVVNAIGYGVMMALEGREALIAKLAALPATGSLADALLSDAEGFVRTRADLVEAVLCSPQ